MDEEPGRLEVGTLQMINRITLNHVPWRLAGVTGLFDRYDD
jgi:hypothetical protein